MNVGIVKLWLFDYFSAKMVVGEQIVQELVHLNDLGFHSVKDIESVHKLSEAMSGENVADLDHILDLIKHV